MLNKNEMQPEETLDFWIRSAWLGLSRKYNELANRHGISMSMGFILLMINKEYGTNTTKIGPKMGMEANSLSRTLKSMEEMELIYRKPDEEDKRKVRICLTPLGIEKRTIALEAVYSFNELLYSNSSKEDLNGFFKVMAGVHETLKELEL